VKGPMKRTIKISKWIFVLSAFAGAIYGYILWKKRERSDENEDKDVKKRLFRRHYTVVDISKYATKTLT
jgi:hypothetical protein